MNWIDVTWPVMGGACLMLGLVHAMAWIRRPGNRVHLVFAVACVSVAIISALERMMMDARDPGHYSELLRWAHVPGAAMFISLAIFVHLQFASSRAWLCALVCITRVLALVANFTTGENINYAQVTELGYLEIFGSADIAVAHGSPNPWMIFGQASILAFIYYLVDTMLREWRAGRAEERWRAIRICGGIAVFVLLVNGWRMAVVFGVINAPDVVVPGFLCVVLVMGHELGVEIMRSADLSQSLSLTEERLRYSEHKAEVAARAGELGLWSRDLVTGRDWVTDLGLRLLGFAPGQAFDMAAFRGRVLPEDRANVDRAFDDALRSAGEYRVQCRMRTSEGWLRHLSIRGQVERDASGQPAQLHGIIADVTDRIQQEERFRVAVEASPTAMLMANQQGTITLANRQAEVVFQYTHDQLLGLTLQALVPDAGSTDAGREQRGRRQDGSEVPVEVALNPIRIRGEQHVLASIADISERRRLEGEAARHRDELAHLSRVALLAELSGSLAHELNQPLTAILSNAQAAIRYMAMDPPDLGEVSESLVNIVDSDKRAGEVIRRLRAMLRKEPPEHRALDMNEVVADVLRIVRSDLLNRSTETVLELDPGLPPVSGDAIQMQQVLLNLITNGCDAMAELHGGRKLVIRTEGLPDQGVRISIVDFGPGIREQDLETIFKPFVSTKAEGMGLGLAVCRTIIESHHGRLWATNNAGPGATFHFTLPGPGSVAP